MAADTFVTLHAIGSREQEKPVADFIFRLVRPGFVYISDNLVTVDKRIISFSGIGCQIADVRAAQAHGHNLNNKAILGALWFFGFFDTDVVWPVH